MKTLFIRILRFLMLLIFIASCGIGYVIYEDTLTAWWIPLGMALLIALVTIPFYKKWIWLTTVDGKVINCLCHLACIGAISYVLVCRSCFHTRRNSDGTEKICGNT